MPLGDSDKFSDGLRMVLSWEKDVHEAARASCREVALEKCSITRQTQELINLAYSIRSSEGIVCDA